MVVGHDVEAASVKNRWIHNTAAAGDADDTCRCALWDHPGFYDDRDGL